MTIINFPYKRPSSCLGKLEIVYHPSLWSTSTEFNNHFLPKICSVCLNTLTQRQDGTPWLFFVTQE